MIFLVITYKKYCGATMAHLIILWYFETLATTSKNIMVLFKNTMAVYYGTFFANVVPDNNIFGHDSTMKLLAVQYKHNGIFI